MFIVILTNYIKNTIKHSNYAGIVCFDYLYLSHMERVRANELKSIEKRLT